MYDFRVTVPPDSVSASEKETIVNRLNTCFQSVLAKQTKPKDRCAFRMVVSERVGATTGIELNCLSVIDDKEHLRAMLHAGAGVLIKLFGNRFSIRARAVDEDGPSIEYKRDETQDVKRKTA